MESDQVIALNGDSVYMAILTRLQIGILANETAEELAAALATWVGGMRCRSVGWRNLLGYTTS